MAVRAALAVWHPGVAPIPPAGRKHPSRTEGLARDVAHRVRRSGHNVAPGFWGSRGATPAGSRLAPARRSRTNADPDTESHRGRLLAAAVRRIHIFTGRGGHAGGA